jgi:hypothetical protein
MSNWNLKQTKQCTNCPWRVGSDRSTIPGYDRGLHEKLDETIAKDINLNFDEPIKFMGCHNSTDDVDLECVGWIENQLRCNNIPLRLRMLSCSNSRDIQTFGKQVKAFEETL